LGGLTSWISKLGVAIKVASVSAITDRQLPLQAIVDKIKREVKNVSADSLSI